MASRSIRAVSAVVAVLGMAALAAGCAPEPTPTPTSSASVTAGPSDSASSTPTPSPTPSDTSSALPASCEGLYSATMLAQLQAEVPPLNDPGTTLLSTQIATGLEVLDSGAPTIRCTWGPPSERGLATSVTLVTPDQSAAIDAALQNAGFSAKALGDGTLYQVAQRVVTQDDQIVTLGETHYLGDGGWIATNWINVMPDGYTQDIVTTLWG